MRKAMFKLSEADWVKVFEARCLSKRGLPLSVEQRALVDAAFVSDLKRYTELDDDVFNATVPFGSNVRRSKS